MAFKGSPTAVPVCGIAVLAATAGIVASRSSQILAVFNRRAWTTRTLRAQLPRTIEEWCPPHDADVVGIPLWLKLKDFFKEYGYFLWRRCGVYTTSMKPPEDIEATCNGFALAPLHHGWGVGTPMHKLSYIDFPNATLHAARTADGRDVVIRLVSIGSEGQNHVEVLKIEQTMVDVFHSPFSNSVGDIVDMVLQCLEALAFIHSMLVAHRDASVDNFLVQWFPESLAPRQLTVSRPRVFLNDFETAVYFKTSVPPEERTCVGLPLCPTFALPEQYFRPIPPEVSSGLPYDPFKLDVWQFGTSLYTRLGLRTTIPEIDDILLSLTEEDPEKRISAFDALKSLAKVVHSMSPDRLNIAPVLNPTPRNHVSAEDSA